MIGSRDCSRIRLSGALSPSLWDCRPVNRGKKFDVSHFVDTNILKKIYSGSGEVSPVCKV